MDSFEYVQSRSPFVVRRTVKWSDCDPAGIALTTRFPDYLLGAVQLFMRHLKTAPGGSVQQLHGIETPGKALSLVFHEPLYPDDALDLHVGVRAIRESSFDIEVRALHQDGRLAFVGTFSPICIQPSPRQKVPMPAAMRAALEPYLLTLPPTP